MKYIPCWGAQIPSATQRMLSARELQISVPCPQESITGSYSVHALIRDIFKINFNIILPSKSSKRLFSFKFSVDTCYELPIIYQACGIPGSSYPP
jgi:hypothetical protein